MVEHVIDELREQGRGVAGALLVVGVAYVFTMETWWHGWQLPVTTLLLYDVVGLTLVMFITRNVGFREEEEGNDTHEWRNVVTDFTELVLHSFVTAYLALLLFGIIEWGDPLLTVVRSGLILVVPLGFGSSLANRLLVDSEKQEEMRFPTNVATFALGAVFVVAPIAPTQEVELMAAKAGWERLAAVVLVSLAMTYLVLYELDFQGQQARIGDRRRHVLLGTTVIAYVTALSVVVGLLASFGHFSAQPYGVWVQETVLLGFPASLGASGAQVVI